MSLVLQWKFPDGKKCLRRIRTREEELSLGDPFEAHSNTRMNNSDCWEGPIEMCMHRCLCKGDTRGGDQGGHGHTITIGAAVWYFNLIIIVPNQCTA